MFCRQSGAGPSDEISQENIPDNSEGSTQDNAPADDIEIYPNPCETAFRGTLEVYSWAPTPEQEHDLIPSVDPKRVIELISVKVAQKGPIRWYLSVQVKFTKPNSEGVEISAEPYFTSKCSHILTLEEDINSQVTEAINKISGDVDTFLKNGSGWVLDRVIKTYVNIGGYKPLKGKSYIPLPKGLIGHCHGIINIQNDDQMCFVWSVLAHLHPARDNPCRVNQYRQYEHELDLSGIQTPIKLGQIPKFERQNNISICVYGYEDEVYPLYITTHRSPRHVNLLLIGNGVKQHYCLIRDLNRFLSSQTKHDGETHFCPYCLHGFTRAELLNDHMPYCRPHGPQKIKMPTDKDKWLKFKNYEKQLSSPFVIYADFECLLPKVQSCNPNPEKSSTTPVEKHVPCGYCYKIVSSNPLYSKPAVVYRGKDPVIHFLKALEKEAIDIAKIVKQIQPMKLTERDEQAFKSATTCHICSKPLGTDRVRDHDHMQAGYNYRGAAHNSCNLNFKYGKHIPVIFHNSRGYDSHLIMSEVGKLHPKRISCIPNNKEKYISFSIGNLRFIDSLQFLNASLSTLVDNLAREGSHKFPCLKDQFQDQGQHQLLLRKGTYPYSYMDSENRFAEKQLPPIEEFYVLTGEDLSEEDYHHAQEVWKVFSIKNLGQYHDLYLLTDVLLLADIFENFRSTCHEQYGLDPAHYYTSPGLAWDAMLKKTGVELELLTDPDMHLFIENGIRGGVSMIGKKYSVANNPYVAGYDSASANIFLAYLDANNLYGWSQSRPLPQKNFKWVTDDSIKNFDVSVVSDDSDTGYILEVDLEYPKELHDLHSDYPLAPENVTVTEDMLSPYSKDMLTTLGMKPANVPKLIPNLRNKEKYILHYRNLKQYLSLGLKLTKIHRILTFDQSPWLKPYIDFNTDKRKQANNDFEKDFFKLMNNSVFGKTMENLRNHVNVELVTSQERLRKVLAKPSIKSFKIFDENLAAVEVQKTVLTLNRPIYVGMTILDLSKTLMYDFYYNHLKANYGDGVKLCMTDTDSFLLEIATDDFYKDMAKHSDLFDTSNYPTDHFLFSNANKKVLGKFKDECPGNPPIEYIGLKPKMYSLDLGPKEKKVAKGVNRSVIRRQLKHRMYKDCLFKKRLYAHRMMRIQSDEHQLSTYGINKISLNPFDDKKYFLSETNNLAHGHFRISQLL